MVNFGVVRMNINGSRFNKKPENIWVKGWLKHKQYCYNENHIHYNPQIDKVVRDLNSGQNRILIVVGTPRSGKSWFSLWYMCYMNWCYFSRKEYEPKPDNTKPIKDVYWFIDNFLEATKDPKNMNKFIMLEEQGVEQYAKDWWKEGVKDFDKLTQIFGVDNTNLIINLPYIFDLTKGTRLKGHYLFRSLRKSKTIINMVLCEKYMTTTTEKAWYKPIDTWEKIPSIYNIYTSLTKLYEEKKLQFNLKTKEELSSKRKKTKKEPELIKI